MKEPQEFRKCKGKRQNQKERDPDGEHEVGGQDFGVKVNRESV